jgi:short-subunit dehydrogenase
MPPVTTTALTTRYGPWALVTGASDGIGRAFATHLAWEGLHVVLVARREDRLRALASDLEREHGVECRVIALDLAPADSARRLDEATGDFDIGLVIASAGFGTSGTLTSADLGNEMDMVDVNCRAVLAQAALFGPRLAKRKRGGMVFLSSLLAFQGTPRAANYAATKAYIQTLAEGLRVEWEEHGVDVIASAPGPIGTGFAARARMNMAQTLPPEVVARDTMAALGRRTTVPPGWLSKLLGWSLATLPRWGQVMVITQVMKGMTQHHQPRAERA